MESSAKAHRRGPSTTWQTNRRYSTHRAARCVPRASPLTSPNDSENVGALCDEATTASHPLDHGRLDHMLTPRCAQTRLSTVRVLGGYIPGSQRDAMMLLPLLEFMYNLMYNSLKNKIYNPKFTRAWKGRFRLNHRILARCSTVLLCNS